MSLNRFHRLTTTAPAYFRGHAGNPHSDNIPPGSSQIIADHTIVDRYDDIPAAYMTEVKKMWFNLPGESHSTAFRNGVVYLYQQDANYPASTVDSGSPEAYRSDALRVSGCTWNGSNWNDYGAGEEEWYTNAAGITLLKNHITYCNTHSLAIAAYGFGWCWDMTWHNGLSETDDPVYGCGWAGSSVDGPDGDLRWGLDAADSAITLNSVCMDTYHAATEQYVSHCATNGYSTKVFFTTGPVEVDPETELGYQCEVKHEYIRDYVAADSTRIFFDYADILAWSNAGEQNLVTWNGHQYARIHADNLLEFNGDSDPDQDGDHIGQRGALRIGKAIWWFCARLAGWDGT